jgi:hypothetical protein
MKLHSLDSQARRALDTATPHTATRKDGLGAIAAKLLSYSPVTLVIEIPNAAGDVDVIVPEKLRVIDARFVKTSATGVGSAKTVTLKKAAVAITNALDIAVADTTVVRAGTIDDASHTIAEGGILRASVATTGQDASGILYVECLREG